MINKWGSIDCYSIKEINMIIRKNSQDRGVLIVTGEDKVARADARLVSVISRIGRALKQNIESSYHCEDSYKQDTSVVTFDWNNRDKVASVVRLNSFLATIEE